MKNNTCIRIAPRLIKSQNMRIAFGCQARAGKDTAADYMYKKYNGEILRFADPLKDIMAYAQQRCGFEQTKDTQFLQMIGTDWARSRDPDVWIKLLIAQVKDSNTDTNTNIQTSNTNTNIQTNSNNYFVSDLRFRNEATALKRAGFTCVRIIRDDRINDRSQTHQSEVDLVNWDGWDYVIENNDTLEEFYKKLDNICHDKEIV